MTTLKFVTDIKSGDHIDVRDCEGDWFEAKILSVTGTIAKCHFVNYSTKWDCNIVLSADNISHRNTHSKSTGKPDNFKYLLECVHELLYLRKENDCYQGAAKEIDITLDELKEFLNRGQPKNDQQKLQMIKWIRTQSNMMGLNLKILEMDEYCDNNNIISLNMHHIFINIDNRSNRSRTIIPAPPPHILASCMASLPKIASSNNSTLNTIIDIKSDGTYCGSKRIRNQSDDHDSLSLPVPKKRKLSNDIDHDIDHDINWNDSDYLSSSDMISDSDIDLSLSDSDIDDIDNNDNDNDNDINQRVMAPQTNGTKITFITVSRKQFEREQEEFQKEAKIAKQEILQKENEKKLKQIEIEQEKKRKKEEKKEKKKDVDDDFIDFSKFLYVLSDANLNLNHSIYPNRKFRGIAKSGRRWRARTCIAGKTQYGLKSFYNPFLAAMEYDGLIRSNRKDELSGAIKTKSQIILNFPYGLPSQTIKIHKLFEKELQCLDQDEIKQKFGIKYKKKKNKKKRKEEPIIDNKGLSTKIPDEFLKKMNCTLYKTDRLKPFGPCYIIDESIPVIIHYIHPKQQKQKLQNNKSNKLNIKGSNSKASTSLFFGYNTLHISPNK